MPGSTAAETTRAGAEERRHSSETDRGIEDALGFVFILGIIIVTLGMVYLAGFDAVSTMQTGEQIKNSERTFETLERNFDDIERRQAPARTAEINLNGGSVGLENHTNVTVDVLGDSFRESFHVGALAYELRDQRVEYANGAVVRGSPEGSVLLTDAMMECGSDVAVLSIVVLEGSNTSVAGTEVVTIDAKRTAAGLVFPGTRSNTSTGVELTVDSPDGDAWNRYLEEEQGWADPDGDDTYTCSGVDEVFVRRTVIDLTFRA